MAATKKRRPRRSTGQRPTNRAIDERLRQTRWKDGEPGAWKLIVSLSTGPQMSVRRVELGLGTKDKEVARHVARKVIQAFQAVGWLYESRPVGANLSREKES